MSDDVDVTVEVESSPESEPDNTLVVVTPPAETNAVELNHESRITALELTVTGLAEQLSMIGSTATYAENLAESALENIASVAEETEEALATVAEEAEAVTPEVVEQVEDVAPNREHPWLAQRSLKEMFGRSS